MGAAGTGSLAEPQRFPVARSRRGAPGRRALCFRIRSGSPRASSVPPDDPDHDPLVRDAVRFEIHRREIGVGRLEPDVRSLAIELLHRRVLAVDGFRLVAAMNPTPDGKMPSESRSSPREIQNYLGRISGPLLDRIDLHVEVPPIKFREMSAQAGGESSAVVRERVVAARGIQQLRWRGEPSCNARMLPRDLQQHCTLDEPARQLLRSAMEELDLSARTYDRILKVARTIADLAHSERLTAAHVSEAIQYRSLDRQIWT